MGSEDKKIYALRDQEFSEKIERITRAGQSAGKESITVVQDDNWLIVGDMRLPVNPRRKE